VSAVAIGPLTPAQRDELMGGELMPFGTWGQGIEWRTKDLHVVVRDSDGRLTASTGLLLAEVDVAGRSFPVVGIGGVIVARTHRGRGLARAVVEGALRRAATMGPDLAMLFCHADKVALYDRLGFELLDAPVTVEQSTGPFTMPQHSMWRALRVGAGWPAGAVAVRGRPF
jgi:predicted N-acetyltransferase YhbS